MAELHRYAHRTVGDFGPLARIAYTVTDATGQAVTGGTVTLRIDGVDDHPMSHQGDGVWTWDPTEGDLDLDPGVYRIEVHADSVALPAKRQDMLVLRARADVA